MEARFTLCWTNVYAYVLSLWSLKGLGGWLGRQPSSPLLSSPSPMAVQRGWTRTWRQLCAAWHPLTQALGVTTSCGPNMLKSFYATLLMGCPCLSASSCTSPCCSPNRSPRSGSFQDRGSSVTVGTPERLIFTFQLKVFLVELVSLLHFQLQLISFHIFKPKVIFLKCTA